MYYFGEYVCLVDVDAGAVIGERLIDKGREVFDFYASKGGSCIANVLKPVGGKVFTPR